MRPQHQGGQPLAGRATRTLESATSVGVVERFDGVHTASTMHWTECRRRIRRPRRVFLE